jgi:trehalose 2-sulfotransferase
MRPRRSYLVCATPRSGSTLLCDLLDRTGVAGHPQEYFEALRHSGLPRRPHEYFDHVLHADIVQRLASREMPQGPPTPSDLWVPERYDRYLEWALEDGTTDNGVFGAKLMWGYLDDFVTLLRSIDDSWAGLRVRDVLRRAFRDPRFVRITREDKVRQAVSLWKAVQTQAWRAGKGDAPRGEPEYDARALRHLVRQLTDHERSWEEWFDRIGERPLGVTYEELAEAHEPVVRRVLQHLEVEVPEPLDLGPARLQVQADAISEEWVTRFLEESGSLSR